MTTTLHFSAEDIRLVRLALLYHLARPGAELDHATGQPAAHGLAELDAAISARDDVPAQLALEDEQRRKLLGAMLGCVNELRVYHLNEGAQSVVRSFNDTARRLFPAMAEDPEAALEVAESMLMLHRRVASEAGSADVERAPEPSRRARWPFRR
jgi:hypothetical protein